MMASRSVASASAAATQIQRVWRGSLVRFFQPRRHQMTYNPEGHLSLGANLDRINNQHELWGGPELYRTGALGFDSVCHLRTNDDQDFTSSTELVDGSDKISVFFAKVMNATFTKKPIHPFFALPPARELERFFIATLNSLESGVKVPLWDGRSTNIPSNPQTISIVSECYVKYRFYMKDPLIEERSCAAPASQKMNSPTVRDNDHVQKLKSLMNQSGTGKCTMSHLPLARVAPRSIYCSPFVCAARPIPMTEDELDERLQRLINIQNGKSDSSAGVTHL